MSALDPNKPVSPRNPDIRFTPLGGPNRQSLEPIGGQLHTRAEAESTCRARRAEFAVFVIMEVRNYDPVDESTPWRKIPVIGVVS